MSLSEAKRMHGTMTIRNLDCTGTKRQRLINLGLYKGAEVIVKRFAPLGDPMIVEVNGCDVAIRKNDAHNVIVG